MSTCSTSTVIVSRCQKTARYEAPGSCHGRAQKYAGAHADENMKVLIFPDARTATARAADEIVRQVAAQPDTVLGLATGGTMEPVYARLRDGQYGVSFSKVTSFNLDEYVGLAPDHPQSYAAYMSHHLFDHLDFNRARTYLPRGNAVSPAMEALRYDRRIAESGGIDLQLLGLGSNGHIGFNEPASSLGSRTRVKTLAPRTRADNARFFESGEDVPRYAITMGIATIMEARTVLLLATGQAKASAARSAIEGPISAFCPGSILQLHPDATVILDEAAAGELALREYYAVVHPGGAEVDLG